MSFSELYTALVKYGAHQDPCPHAKRNGQLFQYARCSCGLYELLQARPD